MPSLLNHDTISTQLRDWQKIGQAELPQYAGHEDYLSADRLLWFLGQAADVIDQQAEEIRVIRANHAQLLKDFDARNELLEKEQQEHLLTKGTLMVREAQLAEERRIYKAARPGTAMPKPEQRCEPDDSYWFINEKGD